MSLQHLLGLATGKTADADPADAELRARMQVEQTRLMFDRSLLSTWLEFPTAIVIAAFLWGHVAVALVAGWLVVRLLVTAARLSLTHRALRSDAPGLLRLRGPFEVMLLLDGLSFGALGHLLWPEGDPLRMGLMAATLIGIASVSLVVFASTPRATAMLVVPMIGPSVLWQALQGSAHSLYIAFGMSVYLVLVVAENQRSAAYIREALRRRYTMDALAAERQQALELARMHSAAKDEFLATMSHEMRTPLHGVLGLARLMRQEEVLTPRQQARLNLLERTGEHLQGLIDDVLDFSKLRSGHMQVSRAPVHLNELLDSVEAVIQVTAQDKGLALRVDSALGPDHWVLADAKRLRQILLNVLGNGVKFTASGRVSLNVTQESDSQLRFVFRDSGPGVPASEAERIFEAFQQADGSMGRQFGGTGLGLTISRALARAMDGDLRCVPVTDGGPGAQFELVLPLRTLDPSAVARPRAPFQEEEGSGPAPSVPAADAGSPAGGIFTEEPFAAQWPLQGAVRVLLAEDNPVNVLVARSMLEGLGLDVVVANDGDEALAARQREPFDMVFMDVQMPKVDGLQATRAIRLWEAEQGLPRMPIVALSANALDEDRTRSLEAGMDAHLAKPFRVDELRMALVDCLPRARVRAAAGLWGEALMPPPSRVLEPSKERLPEAAGGLPPTA